MKQLVSLCCLVVAALFSACSGSAQNQPSSDVKVEYGEHPYRNVYAVTHLGRGDAEYMLFENYTLGGLMVEKTRYDAAKARYNSLRQFWLDEKARQDKAGEHAFYHDLLFTHYASPGNFRTLAPSEYFNEQWQKTKLPEKR
jgi:hypothetical protein